MTAKQPTIEASPFRAFVVVVTLAICGKVHAEAPKFSISGQDKQEHTQSAGSSANNEKQGTDSAPLVVKLTPATKTDEEAAAEAKDRAAKIANDGEIVRFTKWLVIATWVLAGIGVLQVVIYGIQAHQMKKSVDSATHQSKAMERSINEASRAANAMEEVARHFETSTHAAKESVEALKSRTAQQMRAYLCVTTATLDFQGRIPGLKFESKPTLLNAGHTPAKKVSHRSKIAVHPFPLPQNFAFPLPDKEAALPDIGPHIEISLLSLVLEGYVAEESIESIKTGAEIALFAWGVITYEDVFGDKHQTRYCQSYMWTGDRNVMILFDARHNDST